VALSLAFLIIQNFKLKIKILILKKKNRIFCDGGFRSNTPLRDLVQAHRDYWHKTINDPNDSRKESEKEDDVPDLEVYIADLWPSEVKEEPISFDSDFVENRKWGILFGDRTDYDEQVANFVTDYIDLARQLKNLAQRNGASPEEINHILNKQGNSMSTKGRPRAYKDLLSGRFRMTKVVRIDHKDDGHEVGNKIYDYYYETIEKLLKDEYYDTLPELEMQKIRHEYLKLSTLTKVSGKYEEGKDDLVGIQV